MSAHTWDAGPVSGVFGGWAGQLASDPSPGDDWTACSSCSRPTRMTGTKLCDRCWEHHRNAPRAEAQAGPLFGERLKRFLEDNPAISEYGAGAFWRIAAAIDRDAAREIDRLERGQLERARQLRRQIDEAVERLAGTYSEGRKVDVTPLLAELDRIFGDRQQDDQTHVLLHRHVFPVPDEATYPLPTGATHYAHRRLLDGPAIDFWRKP